MKIEFLYPELTNLLGENGSQMFLTEIFGQENIFRTSYPYPPLFLKEDIDLVYMGVMTEKKQRLILELLRPLRDQIKEKIRNGQHLLLTGNSFDLLGREISYQGQENVLALDLYPFKTLTNRYDRYNDLVYGRYLEIEMIGFISQFTRHEGEMPPFIATAKGNVGLKDNNLYAASLLGPLLLTSPFFSKHLLKSIGYEGDLPHQEAMLAAFRARKEQIKKENKNLLNF